MELHGDLAGIIIAVAVLANTLLTVIMGWRNGRKTDDLHKVVNSQLTSERLARDIQETRLVDVTERAAKAEGIVEGITIKEKHE